MGARVLVVEDNVHDRSLVVFLLEALGHEVVVANDGTEALAAVSDANPDLILLDILMPGLDGYQTLHALRALPEPPSAPIIALTILSSQEERRLALAAGFDGYLTKPIIAGSFAEQIDAFVSAELRSKLPTPRAT